MPKIDITELRLPTTLDGVSRDPNIAVEELVNSLNLCIGDIFDDRGKFVLDIAEFSKFVELLSIAARKSDILASSNKALRALRNELHDVLSDKRYFETVLRNINQTIERNIERKRIKKIEDHFDGKMVEPVFSLELNERERIFDLCSEMRAIITTSNYFTSNHKKRLLDRIAQIETELEQREGRFDVILAGLVEFGEALGQFGDKVKPLVDRMREIRDITRAKTTEYEGLPPPEEVKRLPPPDDDGGNNDDIE